VTQDNHSMQGNPKNKTYYNRYVVASATKYTSHLSQKYPIWCFSKTFQSRGYIFFVGGPHNLLHNSLRIGHFP